MIARRRLADTEFSSDEQAANAIFDQIPIALRREVLPRILEPPDNLPSAAARQHLQ